MGDLLNTLKGQTISRRAVWLMRQAGRYLPEYRELRSTTSDFLDMAYNPDKACEVTLQPIRRYDMDGAILFSDILVIPDALGQKVQFVKGEGPKLNPITSQIFKELSLNQLHDHLNPVYKTIIKLRENLNPEKTDLIGFAGAPWTVACYMIQGHGKTGFPMALELYKSDKAFLFQMIDLLVEATTQYLSEQIKSGAQVLQLFDSWAGLIQDDELFNFAVIKPTIKIIQVLKQEHPDIPVICFPRGISQNRLMMFCEMIKPEGLSLSEDIDMEWAVENIPENVVLQGNLSNELLLKGAKDMLKGAETILKTTKNRRHIFNLGHGVIKETPPENVQQLIDFVHRYPV